MIGLGSALYVRSHQVIENHSVLPCERAEPSMKPSLKARLRAPSKFVKVVYSSVP
jgi:hypothetical protein